MRLLSATLLTAITLSGAVHEGEPVVGYPRPSSQGVSVSVELRRLVLSGHLSDLRWPDFSDYRNTLASLYEPVNYSPVWLAEGRVSPQAKAIIEMMRDASEKGLSPQDYDAAKLAEWADQLSPTASADSMAHLDLALSIAAMRYISALHNGRVDPHQAHFGLRQGNEQFDLAAFLREKILATQNVRREIEGIEPPFIGYRHTEAALVRYLALEKQDVAKLPDRPRANLKPGQAYADLPALAARLALLGDLPSPQEAQADIYRGAIVDAIKKFQRRHGLPPSGIVDAPTYRALTTPLSKRVSQLQLTLERWRWLRADILPAIVVNIPEFELRAFDEDHHVALKMHVIVGKAYRHRTPVFEDSLKSVIIRPYWNVPGSIQRAEIIPNLRKDPNYLEKHRFQLVDKGNGLPGNLSRDDVVARLATGSFRVRQLPGPANSLGLLKFDFPNQYNVYMHGTPQQDLFSQTRRDFSHGCIRVEDPVSLATWVLQGEGNWSRQRIVDAMNVPETVTIPVRRPITILLLYGSVVVEDSGEIHFFDDIYGHDALLQRQLAHGYPFPR
jgi:L,D-transpeptidase YcbB